MSMDETKQWDKDIICPICLEHPHNAILLVCSSYDKGCRLFMCDTRNCFQRFRRKDEEGEDDLSKLLCPLCRGSIYRSTVVESARNSMNAKSRSCEACDFSGTYEDLCVHVSSMHPSVRARERLEAAAAAHLQSELFAIGIRVRDLEREGRLLEYFACARRRRAILRRMTRLQRLERG